MIHDVFRLSYIIIASVLTLPGVIWTLRQRSSNDNEIKETDGKS